MSGLGRALLALGLLVITNLGTFGYATWRCRQEMQGQQRLLAEAQQKQQAAEAETAALQQRLDRLKVWGEFIELQQDVNGVHAIINQLNFGNAIQAIDRIAQRLQLGQYGQVFQQHRPELLPLLDRAKQALRNTDAGARNALVELDQRAFAILAGVSAPGELPGALAPTAPLAPTPAPTPTPGIEATPLPAVSPVPTPKPAVI
ncbi:MAG TPA: hypothetical protein VGV61_01565 [Thermoanaerobaculia bacterium]|jgi:hypothetical protein|nr:hypothetical protein [Thermoanaerobaculia bacterium]